MLDCKIGHHASVSVCKAKCDLLAAGFCGTVGGWIWGNPIWGCSDRKINYSRVIAGSCRVE